MRRLGLREVRAPAPSHPAGKRQNRGSSPDPPAFQSRALHLRRFSSLKRSRQHLPHGILWGSMRQGTCDALRLHLQTLGIVGGGGVIIPCCASSHAQDRLRNRPECSWVFRLTGDCPLWAEAASWGSLRPYRVGCVRVSLGEGSVDMWGLQEVAKPRYSERPSPIRSLSRAPGLSRVWCATRGAGTSSVP